MKINVLLLSSAKFYSNNFLVAAARLAGVHLAVEEITLISSAQIQKLELILGELDKKLGLQDSSLIKWNVKRESCV